MSGPHLQPVTDRSAWIGEDLARRTDEWIYRLTAQEVEELEAAARKMKGKPLHLLKREDFDLPALDKSLERIAKEVDSGLGLQLIRGFPAQKAGEDVCAAALWAISTRLGNVISQNAFGDMVGHVRDTGRKLGEKDVRGYDTNSELRFHNDECDIIALMCLRPAKSGGLSSMVSSASMFNKLLATKPEVLPRLFSGYLFSLMGENRPGVGPVSDHLIPIFSWHAGRMSCRYTINTVLQASRYTGIELTEEERKDLFAPLEAARSPGLAINFALEPGDIQLANNLAALHQRTEYVDYDEPEKKRHLLRLWLASHHPRALAREFEQRFNDGWSFRRGIPVTRVRSAA
ncbi:MAG: TauD/TfdA family dioxygenase [Candidatus Parcubacteria bacterium]|nr:TauD/TfdA family dioxygenase [Burkholderiales bacterium]